VELVEQLAFVASDGILQLRRLGRLMARRRTRVIASQPAPAASSGPHSAMLAPRSEVADATMPTSTSQARA
jgi:hypothetical protein